jgi:hypothetical protein
VVSVFAAPVRWISAGSAVVLLGAATAIGLAGPAAAATTITVNCVGSTHTTINSAVADAATGDTIQVCAGTYTESVSDLGKKLTFLGPNAGVSAAAGGTRAAEATVSGASGGTAFTLSGGSKVDGFRITGANAGNETAALFASADGAEVDNSIFDGNAAAMIVIADYFTSFGNLIENPINLGSGIFFNSGGGTNSSVRFTRFIGDFENSAVNVADPDHTNIATGLAVESNSADLTAGGNFVVVGGTSGLSVKNNTVLGSGSSGSGIRLLGDDTDFTINDNYVHGFGAASAINLNGIGFTYAPNGSGTIEQNVLQDNTRAINIADGSGIIEVHYNVLTGNNVSDTGATPPNAAINNATTTNQVNAEQNFFGCDTGPNTSGCDAVIDASEQASQPTKTVASPWLVLSSTIGTHTLTSGQTTTFTANLNHDSDGAPAGMPVLGGIVPVAFSASGQVTVNPATGVLFSGQASTTVKAKTIAAGATATGQVKATVVNAVTTQTLTVHGPVPAKPALSIHDATTAATKNAHPLYFQITLNHKYTKAVTVKFATANGSAKSPANYQAKSGTVTFPAGATSEWIAITIKGTTVKGANKSFFVTIYSPVNATVADPDATGIIRYS